MTVAHPMEMTRHPNNTLGRRGLLNSEAPPSRLSKRRHLSEVVGCARTRAASRSQPDEPRKKAPVIESRS